MLPIPRRYSHFNYGMIQPGLTCAVGAAVANVPFLAQGSFVSHWLRSALLAWAVKLPVVVFAAPGIRRLTHFVTREEPFSRRGRSTRLLQLVPRLVAPAKPRSRSGYASRYTCELRGKQVHGEPSCERSISYYSVTQLRSERPHPNATNSEYQPTLGQRVVVPG
jgi:hypothetical protein